MMVVYCASLMAAEGEVKAINSSPASFGESETAVEALQKATSIGRRILPRSWQREQQSVAAAT
jgi:hypothetical protein